MDGGKGAEVSDRKVVATGMRFVQPVECLDDAVMKKRVWFSIPVFLMLKESIDTDHDGISLDDGIAGFALFEHYAAFCINADQSGIAAGPGGAFNSGQ